MPTSIVAYSACSQDRQASLPETSRLQTFEPHSQMHDVEVDFIAPTFLEIAT
jgi:hypothetical protein